MKKYDMYTVVLWYVCNWVKNEILTHPNIQYMYNTAYELRYCMMMVSTWLTAIQHDGNLYSVSDLQWVCLHGLESRSERHFGTWFKTWLGSWFELRSFTWLQTPFQSRSGTAHCEWYFAPTTQSARADWPMRLCMASARILKMHTHESRSETALRLHGLESGFLGGSRSKTPFFSRFKTRFKSLIWNSFLFTWAKIRLSNQEKAESRFETSFGTWF